jgi:hypothetical protein
MELVKARMVWRIGNGNNVNIWDDPWLPRGITRRVITPRNGSILQKVADLINPITGTWDVQLINDIFLQEDAETILTIPLYEGMEDLVAWHPDLKGMFSVKSAYALAIKYRDSLNQADASTSASQQGNQLWKKIWGLTVPNKIKMFMWRLAHNSHPVRANLARKGIKLDTLCPMCGRLDEDSGHLFLKCKYVKQVWRGLNLEVRVSLASRTSTQDVMESIFALNDESMLKVVVVILTDH